MNEHPILFSAPMVRALLAGTKTQTRRVVKGSEHWPPCVERATALGLRNTVMGVAADRSTYAPEIKCPYGGPGDGLWVRETCRGEEVTSGLDGVRYLADDGFQPINDTPSATIDWLKLHTYRGQKGATVPGIHTPRWASRIALEVTGVRVERLQDISEADAWAEGCARGQADDVGGFFPAEEPLPNGKGFRGWDNAHDWYADLWDEINAGDRPMLPANTSSARYARVKAWLDKHPDTTGWDANPWVWVVEFKRSAK